MVSVAVISTVALFIISIASDSLAANLPFNPRDYPKKIVTCPAINRVQNTQVDIDLRMGLICLIPRHMDEANLIWNARRLCRYQSQGREDPAAPARLAKSVGELEVPDTRVSGTIDTISSMHYSAHVYFLLQDEYHLIAPDLRGFGASTHPGDVKSSGSMPDLVGDLLCILGHAGVQEAIAVGYVAPFKTEKKTQTFHPSPRVARHDWGAQLAYEAARQRPDVFTAVVGITIPVKLPTAQACTLRLSMDAVYSRGRAPRVNGDSGEGAPPPGVSALLRQTDPRSCS